MTDSTQAGSSRAITVPFHGADLHVVEHNSQPYTPMKPIVEGMGLAWQPQHRKLAANKSRWGITELVIPSSGGAQQMTCAPLRKLPGWMSSIESGKVKSQEVRARVIQYQNECDDALWKYWSEGEAINPRAATPYTVQPSDTLNEAQQIALRSMLEANVKRLPHEKQAGAMIQGWSKLKAHFGVPYRQIPAHEFTEALSIISRHVAQWELVDEGPKPVAAPQLISYAARSKAAFDAATRAAGEVQRTVFDAVMNGTDDWKHQRLMLAFVTDSAIAAPAYVQPIESGSLVATWARLTEDIRSGECLTSTAELLDMASACMQRMQRRNPPAASIALSY